MIIKLVATLEMSHRWFMIVAANMTEQPSHAEQSQSGATSGIPEIYAHEAFRRYRLIDLDNTEIERTASELVEGSKLLGNRDLWVANFRATIQRVREWCERSGGAVRMTLVDIRSNKVLFYIVPAAERYDLQLGARMTSLEVELEGGAGIGYVETLQVPERSLERFAGPRSLLVWPQPAQNAEVAGQGQ